MKFILFLAFFLILSIYPTHPKSHKNSKSSHLKSKLTHSLKSKTHQNTTESDQIESEEKMIPKCWVCIQSKHKSKSFRSIYIKNRLRMFGRIGIQSENDAILLLSKKKNKITSFQLIEFTKSLADLLGL